jgi:hypothetical protein
MRRKLGWFALAYATTMRVPGAGRTRICSAFSAGDANLYVYVGNDPLSFVDPLGLCPAWTARGYDPDCDFDGDGTNSGSEIAAYNAVHSTSVLEASLWNALGLFNAAIENRCGAVLVGALVEVGGGQPLLGRNPRLGGGSNPRSLTDLPGGRYGAEHL